MITGFDHVAITVADLGASCAFYERVLGARVEERYEIDGRIAVSRVALGGALLNIHQQGNGIMLVAHHPLPGSADLCFRWDGPIDRARALLDERGVALVEGPIPRVSATGRPCQSIYFRDPDGNLIELMGT